MNLGVPLFDMFIGMILINDLTDRHFAYGGSTIVVVFPKELIEYAVFVVFWPEIDFYCLGQIRPRSRLEFKEANRDTCEGG